MTARKRPPVEWKAQDTGGGAGGAMSRATLPADLQGMASPHVARLAAVERWIADRAKNPISLHRIMLEDVYELATVQPFVGKSARFATPGEWAAYSRGYYTAVAQSLAVMELATKRWQRRIQVQRKRLRAERQALTGERAITPGPRAPRSLGNATTPE
jgi:hypothetical protein